MTDEWIDHELPVSWRWQNKDDSQEPPPIPIYSVDRWLLAHRPVNMETLKFCRPYKQETDTAYWLVWTTMCQRYRIVYTVSKFDAWASRFVVTLGTKTILGRVRTLRDGIRICKKHSGLPVVNGKVVVSHAKKYFKK